MHGLIRVRAKDVRPAGLLLGNIMVLFIIFHYVACLISVCKSLLTELFL